MSFESYDTFEAVKTRLDEIVEAVSDDELSLDDALVLYEEAVGLGLRASDLLEEHIEADREAVDELGDESDDGLVIQPVSDEVASTPLTAEDDTADETGEPVSA